MGLQAGVTRVHGLSPHCPHVAAQGDNQNPRRDQKTQERWDGPHAAEEEGMKELEVWNLQIEFCIVTHE